MTQPVNNSGFDPRPTKRNDLIYYPAVVQMVLSVVGMVLSVIAFIGFLIKASFLSSVFSQAFGQGGGQFGSILSGLGSFLAVIFFLFSLAVFFIARWIRNNNNNLEKANTIFVIGIIFSVINVLGLLGEFNLGSLISLAIWGCLTYGAYQNKQLADYPEL